MIQEYPIPEYDYKKVWKYIKLMKKTFDVSNGELRYSTPTEYQLPEDVDETTLPQHVKERFIIPTSLTIPIYQRHGSYAPPQIPELYVMRWKYDVALREHYGFMTEFTNLIRNKSGQYQATFQEHVMAYAKNRMMQTLPQHEQWKAIDATKLHVEIEDYLHAYIATQILENEKE
jgi:hypothetical protein